MASVFVAVSVTPMLRVPAGTALEPERGKSVVSFLRSVTVTGPIVNEPSCVPLASRKLAVAVIASS